MKKLKQIWRWLIAVTLTVISAVTVQLLDLNIDAAGAQKHLDVFGSTLIPKLAMFSHSWWGAFVLGVIALSTVLAIINAAKDWLDRADKTRNPIAIDFDKSNPNQHFWQARFASRDSDEYSSEEIVQYRVKITNRTDKTIRGVQAKILHSGGWSRTLTFSSESAKICDLHPGASDFVTVYEYDEIGEINSEGDPGYENPRTCQIQVSGIDINTCERTILIDVSKDVIVSIAR